MVICIFGESCVGKSSIAEELAKRSGAVVFTGKDYLRMNKNADAAKTLFSDRLKAALNGENIIYVVSEKEHLGLLPEGAVRVLVTAGLDTIKTRFAVRMNGNLPQPVEKMLENKHGCFDNEKFDIHIIGDKTEIADACDLVMKALQG